MDYEIKAIKRRGDNPRWTILGLEDIDPITGEIAEPDTVLWLFGMESENGTTKEIVNELHRCLYDLYQVNDTLKEGDVFIVKPTYVNKRMSWDPKSKKIRVPKLRFYCHGVHVIKGS